MIGRDARRTEAPRSRSGLRGGFALPVALAVLVLLAVLLTGALFSSNQETRATRAALEEQQLASYAERAAILAVSSWSCGACDLLAPGAVHIESPAPDPPLESTVIYTKLDSALYLVTGEGRRASSGPPVPPRRVSVVVTTVTDSVGNTSARRLPGLWWSAVYRM